MRFRDFILALLEKTWMFTLKFIKITNIFHNTLFTFAIDSI